MRICGMGLLGLLLSTTSGIAAAPEPDIVVRPEPAAGPLDNPLKGWCPYAEAGAIRQPYSMVFQYAPWKDLEPEAGRFAFEAWEQKSWEVPSAKGKHVVLRVFIDYPSRPSGLPDRLRDDGVKLTRYTDHGGGLAPDYDDPKMVAAMERLIAAMGQRYDEDPRVAFIEVGLLGFWGEWHTWPQDKLYASKATERRVLDAYRKAFPHKILLARSARDDAGSRPWLGFHDDMFPEDTDNGHDWSFLAGLRKSGRSDNWKLAAIGGEMEPGRAKKWLGEGYEQSVEMVERGHFTWVGPYCPALDASKAAEFRERSEALVRRMGYQFRLDEVRHPATVAAGGTLSIAIRGENQGVAPFYYPWPVELALIDEAGKVAGHWPIPCDVRTWLPGPFEIDRGVKIDAPAGRYRLALGIIDPWTNRPKVAFANSSPQNEGWTVLSTVAVSPAP